LRDAHIFVAVLEASSLSYAEATWTETLPDWISVNVNALEAFGGAPALFVPDNAKVAVIKACLYDPWVNRSYAEMAEHYGSAVLPARPRKPRDKAKVERAVLIVERWLFGRLRRRTFYSLSELNAAIRTLMADLNDNRVLRSLNQTRRQLFEELDKPALKALPVERYVYAEWRRRRAGLDYHVEIERHFYSVPYRFAREPIEARITARTIELFHQGERIAAHMRGSGNGKHATTPEHMPSSHRRFADWTIERINREASAIGVCAALLCEKILVERSHPEQGFRACLGIVRLVKSFGRERSTSTRAPTARSNPSSTTVSTSWRQHGRRPANPSTTRISGVPDTTTEGDENAATSYPRTADRHGLCRDGPGIRRIVQQRRGRPPDPPRVAWAVARPRMELSSRP
jgi:transposase